eukprot:UN20377
MSGGRGKSATPLTIVRNVSVASDGETSVAQTPPLNNVNSNFGIIDVDDHGKHSYQQCQIITNPINLSVLI